MGDIKEIAKTGQELGKAVREVAKTTSKGIDALSEMVKFVSGPIKLTKELLENELRYVLWKRQQRLMIKAEEFRIQQGLPLPDKPAPLKHAAPLFFHATLEEDDNLQDMWARLLINGTNESTGINLERSFIEILAQISFLEARILQAIYELPFEKTHHVGIVTEYLPEKATIAEDSTETTYKEPPDAVKLALANLARIGCIRYDRSWGGGEIFTQVNPTLMGKEFIKACTFNSNSINL